MTRLGAEAKDVVEPALGLAAIGVTVVGLVSVVLEVIGLKVVGIELTGLTMDEGMVGARDIVAVLVRPTALLSAALPEPVLMAGVTDDTAAVEVVVLGVVLWKTFR